MRQLLKRLCPEIVVNCYFNIKKIFFYKFVNNKYNRIIKKLKRKSKVRVAFFLFNSDTWKADSVYWALERNSRFYPYVVICPLINKGDTCLKENLNSCIDLVKQNNYRFLIGFDGNTEGSLVFRKLPKFDVIFYLNPNNHTSHRFTILNNTNSINCYIPYSFNIDNLIEYDFNNYKLNLMFRIFALSNYHHNQYVQYSEVKGINSFVSGFPQFDRYFKPARHNPWKTELIKRKKVIWAPHWTLPGYQKTGLDWSCFLDYFDIILKFADKYKSQIEFALKPHPFLFNLLSKDEVWGKDKTEAYISEWQGRENCQLYLGDYTDLFLHSDALIHDSGSFTVEYLCINKPVAYTVNSMSFLERFNQIGRQSVNLHQKIFNSKDLEYFIQQVIDNNDFLEIEKRNFVKDVLKADGNSGARIVKHIEELIS